MHQLVSRSERGYYCNMHIIVARDNLQKYCDISLSAYYFIQSLQNISEIYYRNNSKSKIIRKDFPSSNNEKEKLNKADQNRGAKEEDNIC